MNMSKQTPTTAAVVVAKLSNSYIDSVIDSMLTAHCKPGVVVNVAEIGNAHDAPCKLAVGIADGIAKLAALVPGSEAAARLAKIDAKRVQRDIAYSASQRKLAFVTTASGTTYHARGGSSPAKALAAADVVAAQQAAVASVANKRPRKPAAAKQPTKPVNKRSK